eukprot:TRINITY_DN18408_c0_g2_i2.p1 TRINITY_DN18408_c0_g2~~TRINITY_DN18408_c0_g2_i2.p1  ORF type:complete len:242 (+),score=-24.83 TRINITY_DN18408_c0_g2_i2:50-775(+)
MLKVHHHFHHLSSRQIYPLKINPPATFLVFSTLLVLYQQPITITNFKIIPNLCVLEKIWTTISVAQTIDILNTQKYLHNFKKINSIQKLNPLLLFHRSSETKILIFPHHQLSCQPLLNSFYIYNLQINNTLVFILFQFQSVSKIPTNFTLTVTIKFTCNSVLYFYNIQYKSNIQYTNCWEEFTYHCKSRAVNIQKPTICTLFFNFDVNMSQFLPQSLQAQPCCRCQHSNRLNTTNIGLCRY